MSRVASSFSSTQSRKLVPKAVIGIVIVAVIVVVAVLVFGGSGSSATGPDGRPIPVLSPSGSIYRNGQTITVSVGPNKYFAPYSRINIIECGDPGGSTANLPTSDATCDGNTLSGHSVLVNKDGSFSTPFEQLFALPNRGLGETADDVPVCDATHVCVLYVGQNQNDFTAPKVFSDPITIDRSGGGT